jgi:4-diphosphocytidyl-2-C-methyl-D-erythritol kinase
MLTLHSPAKINLFLKIVKKRPDGYHELASLMQTISLFDTLRIRLAPQDRFTCSDPYLPTDSTNLVIAALHKIRKAHSQDFHVHIHLEKQIPVQAGLGGGSGDAATALWGINQLLGQPFSIEQLQSIGSTLGSDVPFFLSEGTAHCRGRGEILQPISPLQSQEVWIVKPLEGLSTPHVYSALEIDQLPPRDPEESLKKVELGEPEYYNDLEEAAFRLLPRLREIKETLLAAGFKTVLLCGSGTAFFCLGDVTPPHIVGTAAIKVKFINRSANRWYE